MTRPAKTLYWAVNINTLGAGISLVFDTQEECEDFCEALEDATAKETVFVFDHPDYKRLRINTKFVVYFNHVEIKG